MLAAQFRRACAVSRSNPNAASRKSRHASTNFLRNQAAIDPQNEINEDFIVAHKAQGFFHVAPEWWLGSRANLPPDVIIHL